MKRLVLPILLLTVPAPLAVAQIDYTEEVRPILKVKCFKCHGGPRAKKDFRMDVPEKFQEHIHEAGYIVPGDPNASEVITRVTMQPLDNPDRMPPPGRAEPLTATEIATLRQWIAEGASFEPGNSPPLASADEPATAPAGPDPNALHQWISAKTGDPVEAYFVTASREGIVLRSPEGDKREFPLAAFAPESIELAKQLLQAQE